MGAERLGLVIEGSLLGGLVAKLDGGISVEEVRVGRFVKIAGARHDFFCLITDVELRAANARVLLDPPVDDRFLSEVLAGTTTYGVIRIQPMLMNDPEAGEAASPRAVRTIPSHFSPVYLADEEDFGRVFGREGDGYFQMGTPLEMEVPVCIDLRRLVQRSNGVFGKSGTGKSFLTRLLLCGVIQAGVAVNLVFDMHSEYGWESTTEDGKFVKGLRALFPGRVQVYSLDPPSDRPVDGQVTIGLNEIEIEDIALLQEELNLNATAVESAHLLADHLKEDWLAKFLKMDPPEVAEFAERVGGHAGALAALRRKLLRISRLPFVRERASRSAVETLVAALEARRHVVLEFGSHRDLLTYMLVSNVLTRRIHERWVQRRERFFQTKQAADDPPQLVITIEEAHKFLNPTAARQTTFGTIARELRKFNVTLLIVDQRPSGIDAEVLSQLGTRITAQLNDEKDIDAIFTGVAGAGNLRSVLASLDSRQQAMILGHAVPMPVVIRTRAYDDAFYRAMAPFGEQAPMLPGSDRFKAFFGEE